MGEKQHAHSQNGDTGRRYCMFSQVISCSLFLSLAIINRTAVAAPTQEDVLPHSSEIAEYGADASGCYYNYQRYEEGDRIITNEPCLNCTCHNRMLMCYLKVCPFTKPIGQDCTAEKSPDQCCPVITCPEVPVRLLTSSTLTSTTSTTEISVHSNYGCTMENNVFYPDGAQVPSDPNKPCELCYCIRNHTACVIQECTLHVDGCKPVYKDDVCCPVRYDCDYEKDLSTTHSSNFGSGLVRSTTPAISADCRYNSTFYSDGELIITEKPCEHCYCMHGDIVCAVQDCGKPFHGKDCIPITPPPEQCCPSSYECVNDTYTTEPITTLTTKIYDDEVSTVGNTAQENASKDSESENSFQTNPTTEMPNQIYQQAGPNSVIITNRHPSTEDEIQYEPHLQTSSSNVHEQTVLSTETLDISSQFPIQHEITTVVTTSSSLEDDVKSPSPASDFTNKDAVTHFLPDEPITTTQTIPKESTEHETTTSDNVDDRFDGSDHHDATSSASGKVGTTSSPNSESITKTDNKISLETTIVTTEESAQDVSSDQTGGPRVTTIDDAITGDTVTTHKSTLEDDEEKSPEIVQPGTANLADGEKESTNDENSSNEVSTYTSKTTIIDDVVITTSEPIVSEDENRPIDNSSAYQTTSSTDDKHSADVDKKQQTVSSEANYYATTTGIDKSNDVLSTEKESDVAQTTTTASSHSSSSGDNSGDTTELPEKLLTDSAGNANDDNKISDNVANTEINTLSPTTLKNDYESTSKSFLDNLAFTEPTGIPGEGSCLVHGKTYSNFSKIPSSDPCHDRCICMSSIPVCTTLKCPSLPISSSKGVNCTLKTAEPNACCPIYICEDNKESTSVLESNDQVLDESISQTTEAEPLTTVKSQVSKHNDVSTISPAQEKEHSTFSRFNESPIESKKPFFSSPSTASYEEETTTSRNNDDSLSSGLPHDKKPNDDIITEKPDNYDASSTTNENDEQQYSETAAAQITTIKPKFSADAEQTTVAVEEPVKSTFSSSVDNRQKESGNTLKESSFPDIDDVKYTTPVIKEEPSDAINAISTDLYHHYTTSSPSAEQEQEVHPVITDLHTTVQPSDELSTGHELSNSENAEHDKTTTVKEIIASSTNSEKDVDALVTTIGSDKYESSTAESIDKSDGSESKDQVTGSPATGITAVDDAVTTTEAIVLSTSTGKQTFDCGKSTVGDSQQQIASSTGPLEEKPPKLTTTTTTTTISAADQLQSQTTISSSSSDEEEKITTGATEIPEGTLFTVIPNDFSTAGIANKTSWPETETSPSGTEKSTFDREQLHHQTTVAESVTVSADSSDNKLADSTTTENSEKDFATEKEATDEKGDHSLSPDSSTPEISNNSDSPNAPPKISDNHVYSSEVPQQTTDNIYPSQDVSQKTSDNTYSPSGITQKIPDDRYSQQDVAEKITEIPHNWPETTQQIPVIAQNTYSPDDYSHKNPEIAQNTYSPDDSHTNQEIAQNTYSPDDYSHKNPEITQNPYSPDDSQKNPEIAHGTYSPDTSTENGYVTEIVSHKSPSPSESVIDEKNNFETTVKEEPPLSSSESTKKSSFDVTTDKSFTETTHSDSSSVGSSVPYSHEITSTATPVLPNGTQQLSSESAESVNPLNPYVDNAPVIDDGSKVTAAATTVTPLTSTTKYKPPFESATPESNYHPSHEPEAGIGSVPSEDEYEDDVFGPGTCRYGGKVYLSAQQIPREDPCDFCFCFRSDIICVQQSCPPPIQGCRQEAIPGYCCPRYECPTPSKTSGHFTNGNSAFTKTSTSPASQFFPDNNTNNYRNIGKRAGCSVNGYFYRVGEEITVASGPCLQCICGRNGSMKCDPKSCNVEQGMQQMIEEALTYKK